MSILIKGINMPSGLAERGVVIRGDGRVCNFIGTPIEGCYAVEVPTPHGRLIDFDAFNDEATKLIDKFYENGEYAEERGANMLRHIAIEQPTIIEAEEGENNEIL